jgi:branched-chain amino acid transport system permease protein
MLGGLIMGLLEALSAGVASYLSDIIVFVVLMLVLFLKPQGLLGRKES